MSEIKLKSGESLTVWAGPALPPVQIIVKRPGKELSVTLDRAAVLEMHFQLGLVLANGWVQ